MISEITKHEIENIIESNKDKKYFVECSYPDEEDIKWHLFYTNHKNEEEISGVNCNSCKTECAQIQYKNAFYDEEYAKITIQSFHEYLISFTIAKLQIVCYYKNIYHTGSKEKIINIIMENTTKEEVENIIESNKDKQYLIFCRNKNDKIHRFFTNNKNKKDYMKIYCDQCETKCTQTQYDNLFYDKSHIPTVITQPITHPIIIPQPPITETPSKKPKQKIPSNIRNIVWNQYIGEKNKDGKCLCCSSENISFANFHCGHIVSEKNGGALTVDNLRPICMNCNLSIGTKNMEEFMKQFGIREPDNWNGKNETKNIIPYEEMKHIVWIKYVCNGTNKKCFVCNDIELTKTTMEYDCLVSNNNDIENMRPTCNDCHKLLKNMGILEFFKLYGIK
jgi:hypothetical protein